MVSFFQKSARNQSWAHSKFDAILEKLLNEIGTGERIIREAVSAASESIQQVRAEWEPKQKEAEQIFQETLRQLKADGHDGTKYVAVKSHIERLNPKEKELATRTGNLTILQKKRAELLAKWEAIKAQDIRELQKAARKVSKRLKDGVRVTVRRGASLQQLEAVLRKHCRGNISQPLDPLRTNQTLNLTELATAIMNGAPTLVASHGFSQASAERIVSGGSSLAMEVEECELPPEAVLELNVGTEEAHNWKPLEELSTRQKATAVLLLLLLEANAPLIVDQPEDDLDNRFIADCIVPAMRDEKRRRQFLFSTHNANIPVLGDAEQIIGLTSVVEEASSTRPFLMNYVDRLIHPQ
jgi:hypothetical protein